MKSYPNPSPETAIVAAKERASKGLTTSSEFGIMNAFILESLQEVTSDPDFPVRVVGALFSTAPAFEELAQLLPNYENYLLKIPFIKTWTDGSMQGGTAHLSDGYHHKDIGEGGAQGSQDFFNRQVLRMYELGYWPAIHANADGAVDVALNAVQYAQETLGSMADAFQAGVKPSMHNDPPVSPVDPLLNMWIAVKRTSKGGRVLGPDQAITPKQALEAYTINAAFQFGMEEDAGSLEAGKFADFVVLDQNPLKIDPDKIRDIHVLATVRGGTVTFADVPEYDRIDPPGGE